MGKADAEVFGEAEEEAACPQRAGIVGVEVGSQRLECGVETVRVVADAVLRSQPQQRA